MCHNSKFQGVFLRVLRWLKTQNKKVCENLWASVKPSVTLLVKIVKIKRIVLDDGLWFYMFGGRKQNIVKEYTLGGRTVK